MDSVGRYLKDPLFPTSLTLPWPGMSPPRSGCPGRPCPNPETGHPQPLWATTDGQGVKNTSLWLHHSTEEHTDTLRQSAEELWDDWMSHHVLLKEELNSTKCCFPTIHACSGVHMNPQKIHFCGTVPVLCILCKHGRTCDRSSCV